MHPVIGLTTASRVLPSSEGETRTHTLYHTYSGSVSRAGGIPVALLPVPEDEVHALLDRLDGLVLIGGGDVDPSHYGGPSDHPTLEGVDLDRDRFELAIATAAAQRRLPLLAICRGLQVLNVALGGTLHVDIASEVPGSVEHKVRGARAREAFALVELNPESALAATCGTALLVNSVHHQSVKDVAPTLRIVGRATDGVVEAVESTDEDWPMLAVQWHPEWLPGEASSASLFGALVHAAASQASAAV